MKRNYDCNKMFFFQAMDNKNDPHNGILISQLIFQSVFSMPMNLTNSVIKHCLIRNLFRVLF